MPRTSRIGAGFLAAVVVLLATGHAGCQGGSGSGQPGATPASTEPPGLSYLLALGTAQDGGLPHASCDCPHCDAARKDPALARLVASVALVVDAPQGVWLIDATPDLRPQLDRLRGIGHAPIKGVDRAPVDGIFLTHAHLGHYTGLAYFGFEAIHSSGTPVYGSGSMERFLRENGPWSQLVDIENIELRRLDPGRPVAIGSGTSLTPIRVPHRDEFTDTLGFVIRGPHRSVLYVPDTDSWEAWDPPLGSVLAGIDIAILDGTFFSRAELPGRDPQSIGHPLIPVTMDALEAPVREGRLRVFFTHLNHSNPAVFGETPERREIERRGFAVLEDGQRIDL